MEGFFYSLGRIFNYSGDSLVILAPFVVVIVLIYIFIVPKNPKVGAGFLAGAGLIGYFVLRSRLKSAMSLEKRIANYHKDIADFKEKQKVRAVGVMANKQIVSTLEDQRKRLQKDEVKYKTEINLIDAEIADRKALQEKLLNETDSFLKESETRSRSRLKLAEEALAQPLFSGIIDDRPAGGDEKGGCEPIISNGFRLKEV